MEQNNERTKLIESLNNELKRLSTINKAIDDEEASLKRIQAKFETFKHTKVSHLATLTASKKNAEEFIEKITQKLNELG